MYLRTGKPELFHRLGRLNLNIQEWSNQDIWMPAFEVKVVGTTGAGDSAYAGFMAALLRNSSPIDALRLACAVGACNVEAPDATSGIRTWADTEARLATDWPTRPDKLPA
jgi:sugar/nucleoside kinase (ribokinase family)